MNKNFTSIRKNQIIAIISGIIAIVSMIINSIFIKRIIDSLTSQDFNSIKQNSIIMICLILTNLVFNYIFQYNFRLIGQTGSFQLRRNYFLNFLNQDYLQNNFKNPSELIVSITSDTSKINDFYGSGIVTLILMLANIITTVSVMIYFNYIIAIGVILLIVLGVLLTNKISEKIGELTVEFQKLSAAEQDQILQSIQGIKTIKMLMKEQFFAEKYDESLKNEYVVSKKLSNTIAIYANVFTFIANLLPLLALLASVFFVLRNEMTVGATVGLMNVTGALQEPITLIGQIFNTKKIADGLAKKNESLETVEVSDNSQLQLSGEFETLKFNSPAYKFGERELLKNMKFDLEKSKIYSIQGESGIGKSTIFNIILKFLPVEDVNILVNGTDVDKINAKQLYKNILMVDQNIVTINSSIKENLTLGEKYSDEELNEVIEVSQLNELIKNKGLDYEIDSAAKNLSGGEKQRISIARILLRKPNILFMDEPTSALDDNTARNFAKKVVEFAHKYDMTLVIISHSSIFDEYSDEIIKIV